jgi:integrase
LHIVPSKTDCERLIPMSPELVQILLAVLRRAKAGNDHVPLSIRYDINEKVHGEPFPHLFARRVGTRQEVLSPFFVQSILAHLASVAELSDAGIPVRFTPHDFRRLFATDVVNGGLPLHIAAALLGHLNLDTTRGYTNPWELHQTGAFRQVAC